MLLSDKRVIVQAEDRTRGLSSYTKPNLAEALILFFYLHDKIFSDPDFEYPINRVDAELAFGDAGEVTFYNEDGERTRISADPSAK